MDEDIICAISTPPGVGGIAVARISGRGAIETVDKVWRGKSLANATTHTAHYGEIVTSDGETLDTAVAIVFKGPKSFTGEDTVELSVHGSRYVQRELINVLVQAGCRPAAKGEFTRRAFANGRLDLASAEAVADMIASESKAAHAIAVRQLKGEYSHNIERLRSKIVDLTALLELELDFSEEDVEFASRKALKESAEEVRGMLQSLAGSFKAGNAIKNGVPVAIVGAPNAGKSTLLNALLAEDRALVSPISGTTRDTIEETLDIDGVLFRLIDTAGIRNTSDTIERMGIERALAKVGDASIVVLLIDPTRDEDSESTAKYIEERIDSDATLITVVNKADLGVETKGSNEALFISAKTGSGVDALKSALVDAVRAGLPDENDMIVTNARHYASIVDALAASERVIAGLDSGISGDFISQDLREVAHHLGTITGAITTTEILSTVFSRFCVGK